MTIKNEPSYITYYTFDGVYTGEPHYEDIDVLELEHELIVLCSTVRGTDPRHTPKDLKKAIRQGLLNIHRGRLNSLAISMGVGLVVGVARPLVVEQTKHEVITIGKTGFRVTTAIQPPDGVMPAHMRCTRGSDALH